MLDLRAARDPSATGAWADEVIVLEAATRRELLERIDRLAGQLARSPASPLGELACTLNGSLAGLPARLCLVASTTEEVVGKIRHAVRLLSDPGCDRIKDRSGIYFFSETAEERGRVAFLFPGEGSQYVNMLSGICIRFPEARRCFDRIDRAFIDHERGYVPSQFIYPPPQAGGDETCGERIWQMDGAVEAVFTANAAVTAVLDRLGIAPDAVMGHSTGDYSALVASGCIAAADEEEFIRLMLDLNRLYQDLGGRGSVPEACLVAVGTTDHAALVSLVAAAGPDVSIAMDNCPHQAVLCGRRGSLGPLLDELRRRGAVCEELSFDRPYHTDLFRPVCGPLKEFYGRLPLRAPRIPVYSGATAAPLPAGIDEIKEVCVSQWAQPVRFRETIEAMYADGIRIFVEAGPRGNLTAFVNDILRGRPHLAVPADVPQRSSLTQLNHLVAVLSALGIPVRFDPLYASRRPRDLTLGKGAGAPTRRSGEMKLDTGCPQVGLSEEAAAALRRRIAGSLAPKEHLSRPLHAPPANGGNGGQATEFAQRPATPATGSTRVSDLVSAHLQTMESFLNVQREVIEAYLSGRSRPAAGSEAVRRVAIPSADPAPPPIVAPQLVESPIASPPAPGGEAEPGTEPSGTSRERIAEILLGLVSERTGYPIEMLNLDLDLEADLGIDSIKRVEILGSLQQTLGDIGADQMEQLSSRKTLKELIDFIGSGEVSPAGRDGEAGRVEPAVAGDLPFIGSILSRSPHEAVATREIRLDEDLFLKDHALGHRVSEADPELRGLPVVPLTMAMEMLAEVASILAPGLKVVGMKEIRAHRWMSLERGSLRLRLTARRDASTGEVIARIAQEQEPGQGGMAPPIVEGRILFAEEYPEPPSAGAFGLKGARASRWSPDRLYTEGMFHGPSFRGVSAVDRWGEDGAEATLKVLPRDAHRRSGPSSYLTDPVLLDQPGQVVGFWMAEHLDEGFVVFPFRLGALHLYAPPAPAGTSLTCRARIDLIGKTQVRSDLDIVGAGGRLLARFEEWEDRRFYLPRDFARLLLAPGGGILGRPLPAIIDAGMGGVSASGCLLDLNGFPEGLFEAHGGVWREVLARFALSAAERDVWRSLRGTEEERLAWLIGRVAAKDAAILLLGPAADGPIRHADLEILEDGGGLTLGGIWAERAGRPVTFSVARNREITTALAVTGHGRGIGIAIEKVVPGSRADLTSHERGLIDGAGGGGGGLDWIARLVCAKEAVSRALGRTDSGSALQAERLDPASGRITLKVNGGKGSEGPSSGAGLVAHTTRLENGTIVATSISLLGS